VVFTPGELAQIAELACEHDLLVVSDEVYEHMVYEGSHLPIVSLPGMSERTVTISSAAKMFSFTGWKIGWVTGSPELVTAVRTVKQFLTYVSGGPFQYAVAEALALPDDFYASISADLRVKRDFFGAGLAAAGFEVYWPAGTYFITTDVRPLGYADGMEFCRELPGRVGVVAIPSVVFYDNVEAGRSQVRFAFCKQQDVLAEALSRLARAGRDAGGQEAS
jgi:N-succinyldiaminopimelate aminotransferase